MLPPALDGCAGYPPLPWSGANTSFRPLHDRGVCLLLITV